MFSSPSPFSFVIFGASGHLAQIKLYPALYFLARKERFPHPYNIVGFSRSEMDDASFRSLVESAVREHVPEVNEDALTAFLSHVHYVQGDYSSLDDFGTLSDRLDELESDWKDHVRLAYFSIPPTVFADVSVNLCKGGVKKDGIPLRCIVEKPVGHGLASFESIRDHLLGCFDESDIYLLDHYFGKEAVRNVYYLRYANPLLERLFKNTLIHHVEITAAEMAGLEGRAGYFEAVGTFRDMFQSHLLMITSLLTMRLSEQEESVVHSRTDALNQLYLPPAGSLDEVVLQGQYAGYLDEDGVESGSRTNTFAALKLKSRTSRWEGVPFYLRSGKKMGAKETRISVEFQEPRKAGQDTSPNRLDIILQGEAGMRLHLQTKLGGSEPKFRPLLLSDPLVCMGDCLPEHGLLLLEAIHGMRQWFLTFSEIQTAWRLIDPVQAHLDQSDTPLYPYSEGSEGPSEVDDWIAKDGASWVSVT